MKLAIDSVKYREKPNSESYEIISTATANYKVPVPAAISSRITKRQIDVGLKELVSIIKEGRSFTVCSFRDGPNQKYPKRDLSNFDTMYMVGLDLDNPPRDFDPSKCEANIVYQTFSHTANTPKYRLLFKITPTDDINYAKLIILYYLNKYKYLNPDTICKDPVRVFYGTNKEVLYLSSEVHKYPSKESLLKEFKPEPKREYKSYISFGEDEFKEEIKNLSYLERLSLNNRLNKVLRNLEDYDNRSRYECFWYTSLMMAKIGIPESIAWDLIKTKFESIPHYSTWDKDPKFVFNSGYTYGITH